MVSLLVIVAFVAVGILVGVLLSLPSGGLAAAAGGGHGGSPGSSLAQQGRIVLVAGASGAALALALVWGIWRNYPLCRWFGAASISALAILLACFIYAWRDPFVFVVAALLVPVLCGAFLYAESRGGGQGGSQAGR